MHRRIIRNVSSYLRVQQVDSLCGLKQLMLSQLARAVVLLQQSPELLHLSSKQVVSALGHRSLLLQLIILVNSLVQLQLNVLESSASEVGC